jgi:drug/metabolite transporter (DMT)-like permease
MSVATKSYIKLHLIVIILGFTAVLGKLITLSAVDMIWYRMLIAAISLGVYVKFKGISVKYSVSAIIQMAGVGLIIAIHWIAFFYSIKISNVSVALGCFASFTFFTSILEPVIFRRKFNWLELLIGVVIIIGLYIIFQFEFRYKFGIITSVLAALLAALFTVLNKKLITNYHPVSISFFEMASGFVWITIYMVFSGEFTKGFPIPSTMDWVWLLVLGVVCTSYAFVVSVGVMKVVSAYTVSLAINMEPVYGIILASLIFQESEYMSGGFYAGTIIIIIAVFMFPVLNRRASSIRQELH